MDDMEPKQRIGEVAAAAGVSIRTLHHYESIGLLPPTERTDAGYRIYGAESVRRIYQICVLRRLGMPLAQIGRVLDGDAWGLTEALRAHLEEVERRQSTAGRLRSALVQLLAETTSVGHPTRDLMEVLTEMTTLDSPIEQRIQILVYADVEAAMAFLVDVLDLGPGALTHNADGVAVHGAIDAGDGQIWLHPESPEFGLASPRSLGAATATTAVMVDDVDAHHARVKGRGAAIVYPPVDQVYGYREYSVRDPEGGLWSFMKALPDREPA